MRDLRLRNKWEEEKEDEDLDLEDYLDMEYLLERCEDLWVLFGHDPTVKTGGIMAFFLCLKRNPLSLDLKKYKRIPFGLKTKAATGSGLYKKGEFII